MKEVMPTSQENSIVSGITRRQIGVRAPNSPRCARKRRYSLVNSHDGRGGGGSPVRGRTRSSAVAARGSPA